MKAILMPGMDGTGVLLRSLAKALPESDAVVMSYPPDTPLTYSELLPIVRTCLPANEPFILVAESFSGPLALMLAAEHPPNLRAVVLSASFIRNPVWFVPSFLRFLARATPFRLFAPFTIVKALLGGYGSSELRQLLREANAAVSPAVLASRARSILAVNVTQQLRTCSVPILYIRGTEDHVVPERCLRQILLVNPDVQVVRLKAPHLVLQVKASEAARAIQAFCTATAGAV